MLGRRVEKIRPIENGEEPGSTIRPFSDFLDVPNLVLLGDPGSGKSFLFDKASQEEKGKIFTARTFMTYGAEGGMDRVLYIDGLDEQRSRTEKYQLIDGIVKKVLEIKPAKLRVSCRAADWLGETDLEIFRRYFEESGGYVVLSLQPLTSGEVEEILVPHGICDVVNFIKTAEAKGVEEWLRNPQTLIMLAKSVQAGNWPETKNDLFEKAVKILLTEHNLNKARCSLGQFSPDALVDAAGAACASLLISDTPGISLLENQSDEDFPSYTQVPFDDQSVLSALTRRAFTAVGDEIVNYSHRMVAEFLGAVWLAGKVEGGFPIGRLQSLIGIYGQPAPELRGLHAWLAVKLPMYAETFINSDPYGVLVYGDPAKLAVIHRKALLKALEKLAEKDPWFYSGVWASEPLGGLSSPEMVEEFRNILSSSDQFHLRCLVLDAITHGPQLPKLAEDLLEIFCNEDAPYDERDKASEALIKAVPDGASSAVAAVRGRIVRCGSSARLRASVISQLYQGNFSPTDVLHIFEDVLGDDHACALGEFWCLNEGLPLDALPEVLDLLSTLFRENERLETPERRNESEVELNFSQMLTRILYGEHTVDSSRIWNWLAVLYRQNRHRGGSVAEEKIISWLARNKILVLDWFKEEVEKLDIKDCNWNFWHDFKGTVLWQVDQVKAVEIIFEILPKETSFSSKDEFLYELALTLCFSADPPARKLFEVLYQLGDRRIELIPVRERACQCQYEDWRLRNQARKIEDNSNLQLSKETIRIDFEKNIETIRIGKHDNWLNHLAKIYFAIYSDVDRNVSPESRLENQLGSEYSEIALEGLRASVNRTDLPSIEDVAENYMRDTFHLRWIWVLAGMDECWQQKDSLQAYSDEMLRVSFAIELLSFSFCREENAPKIAREWKKALFESRKDIVIEVFSLVIRIGLEKKREVITGLYEFFRDDDLVEDRGEVALHLLRDFPNARTQHFRVLLIAAMADALYKNELIELVLSVLKQRSKVKNEQRTMWLSVIFLYSFENLRGSWKRYFLRDRSNVWVLCGMVSDAINHRQNPVKLAVAQIEFLIKFVGKYFENVDSPEESSGDQNPWDASNFVRRLVEILSLDISSDAISLLHRLSKDDSLLIYGDQFKHAASNQNRLKVQKDFMRPDWESTINVFAKGEPAYIADLHALAIAHLRDVQKEISNSNVDLYKSFWNEDSHGRIESPKQEESCRDQLIKIIRTRLNVLNVRSEPEGHMAADKRTDIVLFHATDKKLPLELKRDTHTDLWTACENQLDRLYTRDPEASSCGIYVVFWFGEKRKGCLTGPPRRLKHLRGSDSPEKLEEALRSLINPLDRQRLEVVVIDVTKPSS